MDKILFEHELFKHTRFLAQMSMGAMPHDKVLRSIELFGTHIAPQVRKALGKTLPKEKLAKKRLTEADILSNR